MAMLRSPLVYVGPTLRSEEVSRALPGSIIRPAIRRGDLYRDRLLKGSVFVILDGVFFQQQAVSLREILDVIQDGALVIGAASMGALRAAECWPGTMLGVGSIYRLFRAGALGSDDEVAVAFDADEPSRRASVALVNVRYAVWRAVRTGQAHAELGKRIVASAQSLFYADRRWPAILTGAGVLDLEGPLARSLADFDLKRLDALRALRRVERWRAKDPEFCSRPRQGLSPFVPSEAKRERAHDALGAMPAAALLRALASWLVASGRYLRYTGALGKRLTSGAAGTRRKVRGYIDEFLVDRSDAAAGLAAAVASSGELDAELFRFQAVERLAARAKALELAPSELDRHEAEQTILLEHDFESWEELCQVALGTPQSRELVTSYREHLSRACAMRRQFP